MLITHNVERQQEMLRFFKQAAHCGTAHHLYTLFYLADFLHFQQVARTISGLTYSAEEQGPVPHELDIRDLPLETPAFNDSHFSPRMINLLNQVGERHSALSIREMDALVNNAWQRTYRHGGQGSYIHPLQSLHSHDKDSDVLTLDYQEGNRVRAGLLG